MNPVLLFVGDLMGWAFVGVVGVGMCLATIGMILSGLCSIFHRVKRWLV